MLILSAGVIRSQLRERFAARCDISFTSSTNQVVAFARFFSCAMCYAMYKCVFPFFVYKYWNDLEWIFRLFNPCIHVYMCHIYRIMILYIFFIPSCLYNHQSSYLSLSSSCNIFPGFFCHARNSRMTQCEVFIRQVCQWRFLSFSQGTQTWQTSNVGWSRWLGNPGSMCRQFVGGTHAARYERLDLAYGKVGKMKTHK